MPVKGRNGRMICWAFKQTGSFVFYWVFNDKLHYFLFIEYYFKSDLVKGSKTQAVLWWPVDVPYWFEASFYAQNFGNSLQARWYFYARCKVRFNPRDVRFMLTSHQSDSLLLHIVQGWESDVVLDKFKVPLHGILLHTFWRQYHTSTRNFSGKLTMSRKAYWIFLSSLSISIQFAFNCFGSRI